MTPTRTDAEGRTIPFWDAVKLVESRCPQNEWTWMDWLCVIDLADVPCYHPVEYRLCVGDWGMPGVTIVSEERFLDAPEWMQEHQRTCRPGDEYETYCPVCSTFCPAPPVDVRKMREAMLMSVLHAVSDLHDTEDES